MQLCYLRKIISPKSVQKIINLYLDLSNTSNNFIFLLSYSLIQNFGIDFFSIEH